MNNKIIIKVNNNYSYLEGSIESSVYKELREKTSYLPESAKYMIENSGRDGWDGRIPTICYKKCRCHNKKNGTHFPTGILYILRQFFKERNIPLQLIDERQKPLVDSLGYVLNKDILEERDYQIDSSNKALNAGRGILKICTGGGKTPISARMIAEAKAFPFMFYVPSVDLLNQTAESFEKFILKDGKPITVGRIGGGQFSISDINVATIQTAVRSLGQKFEKIDDEDILEDDSEDVKSKYPILKQLIMESKGFIIDECHKAASATCQAISDFSVSAYFRWGASATPFRDLGDDILIEACFGKTLVDISASDLIEQGFLVKPTIYFIHMNNFNPHGLSYSEVYKKGIVENSLRNKYISNLADKFYNQNRNVLTLVKNINHGKILEQLIKDPVFIHGSSVKKKRESVLNDIRENKIRQTISSTILDEGIDCRPWDTLILAGAGKSATRAFQRIGRTLRPYENKDLGIKKTDAIIIDFYDNCKYLKSHSMKRMALYKRERQFKIEKLEI